MKKQYEKSCSQKKYVHYICILYNKYAITIVSHVSRNAKSISQGFSTSPVSKDGQSSLFGQSMKPSTGRDQSWELSWRDNRNHRSCLDSSLSSIGSSEWGSPGKVKLNTDSDEIEGKITWVEIVLGQVSAVERRLGIFGSTSSTNGSLHKCIL